MGELIKGAWSHLYRKRQRTWLTVMGIAVGVMLVAAVAVISAVGRAWVDEELDSMGVGGLSVMAPQGGELISEETLLQLRAMPCVGSAMPLMVQLGQVSAAYGSSESALCGIDAGADQVISLKLCHGRLIEPGDVSSCAKVCVLDESLAKTLFGRCNVVGRAIEVQYGGFTDSLTVIGVSEAGSSLLQNVASLIPGMVYLPYTTHSDLTGQTAFDQVAIRVSTDSTLAKRQVERLLNRMYDGASPFRTDDLAVQKERLEGIVDLVVLILTVISGISLVVAGFGIVTAMLSSVSERTKEIGIKKAIGASNARILSEFLTEALMLSAAGALVGMIPAAVLLIVLEALGFSAAAPWALFGLLFLFSLVVGGVFGAYPAYKASRLQPVEALRSE